MKSFVHCTVHCLVKFLFHLKPNLHICFLLLSAAICIKLIYVNECNNMSIAILLCK